MFNYTKAELAQIANQQNFIRDTLEKVMRLTDVSDYMNSIPIIVTLSDITSSYMNALENNIRPNLCRNWRR